ncbi:hypothetical protein O181_000418 [Austropuccinia psidii MF-1]|uniref:Uncharacterized protein n=1 Tax=Austropuccinia psidii MF-1 TaxID=1389203 RepID=A0A9Q3GAV5_9BASI|nr:hypothetical protein [Austropuccinia psidii MF-1]
MDLRIAYQATVLLWPIGHINHQWPIWPRHHLMDHLWPSIFWGLHGPSPQSRSHSSNLCTIGYFWSFPSKPGEMARMAVLAIWAHNAHLRILRTLMQSVQKTLSRPLGQFLAQNPKVAKSPKGPRNSFPSSEAITSIFLLSSFPSQHLWT